MERGFIVLFSAQKVKSNDSYLSSRRTQDLMCFCSEILTVNHTLNMKNNLNSFVNGGTLPQTS